MHTNERIDAYFKYGFKTRTEQISKIIKMKDIHKMQAFLGTHDQSHCVYADVMSRDVMQYVVVSI